MTDRISELLKREGAVSEEADAMADEHASLPEHVKVTRGHGRTRTLQVRLNGDEYEALEFLAKARDLPVSTVARSLLLTVLAPSDDVDAALNRMEHQLAVLRRLLDQR